tara:strand:- start:371 stop:886 length:516 start_codon:yes stop_codon:yes gene_type:complete
MKNLFNMKPIVQDNFLPQAEYDHIKKEIFGEFFPWYFHNTVATKMDKNVSHFFWTHMFFNGYENKGITSSFYHLLNPIIKKLKVKALIRAKANLYSNQSKIIEHDIHTDYPFKHKGILFSLNTCNGFTEFEDKTKIQSVENRVIFFDPSLPHHSSTCTDAPTRVNLNFNYF